MSTLQHGRVMPELLDWFESPFLTVRPSLAQDIRLEDYLEDDRYVVRAELAGIDPEKDLAITVGSGYLTILAERYNKTEGRRRSEFRYGTFTRSVALPATANEEAVTASCENGILTITIPLAAAEKPAARKVPVSVAE